MPYQTYDQAVQCFRCGWKGKNSQLVRVVVKMCCPKCGCEKIARIR